MSPPSSKPSGSTASKAGDRPRAQISYEGEDEFSAMSLDPERRRKPKLDIEPSAPGASKEVKIDDLKPKKSSLFGFVKAIFEK
jgi:hypothetical protein